MKKLILILIVLILSSCSNAEYIVISDEPVDGYYIYEKTVRSMCRQEWTDIYYSGEVYNYGYSYSACNWEKRIFIKSGEEYRYLWDAIEAGLISIESLRPHLDQIEREPEEIETDEADYYWMDFHINHQVVYVYAGGECDQAGSEEFIIHGVTYVYEASGCLQEHLLYMRVDGDEVPVADLILDGTVNPDYLIPLLTVVE